MVSGCTNELGRESSSVAAQITARWTPASARLSVILKNTIMSLLWCLFRKLLKQHVDFCHVSSLTPRPGRDRCAISPLQILPDSGNGRNILRPLPASHTQSFGSETAPAFLRTIWAAQCPRAESPCLAGSSTSDAIKHLIQCPLKLN